MGQGAADLEAAEIHAAWHDHEVDGVASRRVTGRGVIAGEEAHGFPPRDMSGQCRNCAVADAHATGIMAFSSVQ
jgi:hypothetical protein